MICIAGEDASASPKVRWPPTGLWGAPQSKDTCRCHHYTERIILLGLEYIGSKKPLSMNPAKNNAS